MTEQRSGFFAAYRQRWWRGSVVVVGILLSLLAFFWMEQQQQRQRVAQFNREVELRIDRLEQTLVRHLGALEALGILFAGSDRVTGAEFARAALDLGASRPALERLQWRPAQGQPATGGDAGLYPVSFEQLLPGQVSPMTGNASPDPAPELLLAQRDVRGDQGIRRGQVSGLLRVGRLVAQAGLPTANPAIQWQLREAGATARTLYTGTRLDDPVPDMTVSRVLQVAGLAPWTVTATPSQRYLAQQIEGASLLVLALGLFLTLVAHVGLRLLLHRSEVVERLVDQRTAELHRALERLNTLAITDELTGLANRRHFDDTLERECRRAIREFMPLTLIMVDVDCFKAYNDRYGHPAGDRCLRQVADALRQVVARPGDLVARYGGEELALLLPSTNEQALELAERCRQQVRGLGIRHEASEVADIVTVSIGICTLQPSAALTPWALSSAPTRPFIAPNGRGGIGSSPISRRCAIIRRCSAEGLQGYFKMNFIQQKQKIHQFY
ncbi:diguanylate cyclase [Marinobacterium aestuariivivens]|uniref:diguanylate cyclase n=1 Tax=Marinobacterium aestuariivivens TaxID=1698799 RepID=A0ABW1ZU95_9GAMM